MKKMRHLAAIAAACAMVAAPQARAATGEILKETPGKPPGETPWVAGPEGRVRLVAGGGRAQRWLGLAFDLKPGWKIFWRSPGAPGAPPVLDWTGSENLKSARIIWPAPEVFTGFGFKARGYGGRVTLPIEARAGDPRAPLKARLLVRYQVCKDVCIPGEASLAIAAPPGGARHPAIGRALARVPKTAGGAFADWRASLRKGFIHVRIRHKTRRWVRPVILVEAPEFVRLGRSDMLPVSANGAVSTKVRLRNPAAGDRKFSVRVTLMDGGKAWEKTVPVLRQVLRRGLR